MREAGPLSLQTAVVNMGLPANECASLKELPMLTLDTS
jgi:hypothetical protein